MQLKIKNLSKQYNKKYILKNIDIELSTGEVLALIGRNGSGKTTFLKLLVGILEKNSGDIFIDDKNIYNKPELLQELIYIPDKFEYFKYTRIKKVISFYKIIYPKFDENYFLENLSKNNIAVSKKFSQLSKGEKMIVAILIGLSCKTSFIFLDEPLDGIDILNINKILDYIIYAQEKGVGIIVSSHQLLQLSKISDKIYYLDKDNEKDSSSEINIYYYKKYQVVYDSEINKELLEDKNVKIVSEIGRVYTIVVFDKENLFEKKLVETNPIQYDELAVTLEDVFVFRG